MLTSVDRVISWAKKDEFAAVRQGELERCIAAASSALARVTGRQIERATRSILLDGHDAGGQCNELLYLPKGDRPVLHAGGNLVTVSENGSALTVTTGYSTSNTVQVKGANIDAYACLIRTAGSWSPGYQNIVAGYKCGWTLDVDGDAQPLPEGVIQLASCISWMLFNEPAYLGKLNVSQAGSAVTLSNDLPPYEASILSSLVIR